MADARLEVDLLADLEQTEAAQVVRCARVLLRRPLLRVGGPEGDLLPVVFRYRTQLQRLFARHLGYRLTVERRYARLRKAPATALPGRPEAGLSPRGHTYLALLLAVLVGAGDQVLISRLVADVRAAAAEAGVGLDDSLTDLRALGAALRHLLELGVLSEVEGAVAPWAHGATPEALLQIDTELLGVLVRDGVPAGDSPDRLLAAASGAEPVPDAVAVRRRLVEDPVVLDAELIPARRRYLRENHRHEGYLLERYFGLLPEIRAEGMLAVDPEEYLTDVRLPSLAAAARLALLMLVPLLAQAEPRAGDGRCPVSVRRVHAVAAELFAAHPVTWGKNADSVELAADAMELLVRCGLAVRTDSTDGTDSAVDAGWLLSPAAHRWRPQPVNGPAAPPATPPAPENPPPGSLFDGLDERQEA